MKNEQDFTTIPYYAWANRGRGEMIVWIPNNEASARPRPFPTIATTSKVTVSGPERPRLNPRRINDGEEPVSSSDSSSYFDWWPKKGSTEWVEYAFEKPATVSEVEIYWFDDTGRGEVRVPQAWRVLYKDGNEWKPVESASPYGVEKDVSHNPDMPLAPGVSAVFGLGLWKSIPATLIVEGGFWLLAIIIYVHATRAKNRAGVYACWPVIAFLTLAWHANITRGMDPNPANPNPVRAGIASLIFFSLSVAWAYWMNRLRPAQEKISEANNQ
ncbi:MAG: hypothetical protein ACREA2_06925 [Blastocatellia bacterium]